MSRRSAKKALRKLQVTLPGGHVVTHPDDGREYPPGTMLMWSETLPDGRREMRWTITGGGCPYDLD